MYCIYKLHKTASGVKQPLEVVEWKIKKATTRDADVGRTQHTVYIYIRGLCPKQRKENGNNGMCVVFVCVCIVCVCVGGESGSLLILMSQVIDLMVRMK